MVQRTRHLIGAKVYGKLRVPDRTMECCVALYWHGSITGYIIVQCLPEKWLVAVRDTATHAGLSGTYKLHINFNCDTLNKFP
jgi:hypothetical protein